MYHGKADWHVGVLLFLSSPHRTCMVPLSNTDHSSLVKLNVVQMTASCHIVLLYGNFPSVVQKWILNSRSDSSSCLPVSLCSWLFLTLEHFKTRIQILLHHTHELERDSLVIHNYDYVCSLQDALFFTFFCWGGTLQMLQLLRFLLYDCCLLWLGALWSAPAELINIGQEHSQALLPTYHPKLSWLLM